MFLLKRTEHVEKTDWIDWGLSLDKTQLKGQMEERTLKPVEDIKKS